MLRLQQPLAGIVLLHSLRCVVEGFKDGNTTVPVHVGVVVLERLHKIASEVRPVLFMAALGRGHNDLARLRKGLDTPSAAGRRVYDDEATRGYRVEVGREIVGRGVRTDEVELVGLSVVVPVAGDENEYGVIAGYAATNPAACVPEVFGGRLPG